MKSVEQDSRMYCSLLKKPGSWLTFYYTQQRTSLDQSGKQANSGLLQFIKKAGGKKKVSLFITEVKYKLLSQK